MQVHLLAAGMSWLLNTGFLISSKIPLHVGTDTRILMAIFHREPSVSSFLTGQLLPLGVLLSLLPDFPQQPQPSHSDHRSKHSGKHHNQPLLHVTAQTFPLLEKFICILFPRVHVILYICRGGVVAEKNCWSTGFNIDHGTLDSISHFQRDNHLSIYKSHQFPSS